MYLHIICYHYYFYSYLIWILFRNLIDFPKQKFLPILCFQCFLFFLCVLATFNPKLGAFFFFFKLGDGNSSFMPKSVSIITFKCNLFQYWVDFSVFHQNGEIRLCRSCRSSRECKSSDTMRFV